ncbi:Arc family DNA-binding protein [Pseudomonas aeruginosa]|nr:Arc family DNA-binding protein [Pseudomonas aeruginosa]MCV4065615.1 Arc family DNA-binding protein [Pseudomonas aeruginosa]MCV4078794.1 Arc family DNA-binding protein [Pseudomonas aeruginosa]MCV4153768.1 Arc family DNA-binding protein [Pseudomonas aeruginosa]MCV4181361.1 Arc family DNA-binding protein [Pseudomonas aeruginosa]MCV4225716.1 Arc family DNA-binding protein [Pseudomonas aeruginosa]
MKGLSNPLAIAAMNRAIAAARIGPAPRPKYNSRTADKFVMRGFDELFDELAAIGRHQGRSLNSESVAAVLEALAGVKRASAMVSILKAHLGEEVSARILAEVPSFDLAKCKSPRKFVMRLPPSVRDTIREGVVNAVAEQGKSIRSMNAWLLDALVDWINVQRQQYALLAASIAMEQGALTGPQ